MNQLLTKAPWVVGIVSRFFSYASQFFKHLTTALFLLKTGISALLLITTAAVAFGGAADLSWNANTEPDLSGYKVYYGASSGNYGTPISVGNTTSHSLTNLSDGTYFFAVTAIDTSGNESGFSNEVSKTLSASDSTAPIISTINAGNTTSSGSTITWTTDEVSDTQIEYGTTTAYGSITSLNTSLVTSHSHTLSGLNASTTYHYRVLSRDASGNLGSSGDNTFTTTTAASDTTPPSISGIISSSVTTTAATVSWTTSEGSDTRVEYGTTTGYGSTTSLNTSLVTSHSQTLSGLSTSTPYHYRVISQDAAGNVAVSGDNTFTTLAVPDTTAPAISGMTVSTHPGFATTITWATDEGATSQVEYGTTSGYGSFSSTNTTLGTSHSVTLSGLSDATTYHFRVISQDGAGNTATSGDNTFTTNSQTDTTPPVVTNIASTHITASSATVIWGTDEAATSQVAYGTSTNDESLSPVDTTLVTSHSRTLTGLTATTTYHYAVISTDASGNTVTGPDRTFTTGAPSDTTGPLISNIGADTLTQSGATIRWATDEAATSQVDYGTTTAYGSSTTQNATLLLSHAQVLSGLTPGALYHYRVLSVDAEGNLSVSSDATFQTAPVGNTTPTMDIAGFTAVAEDRQVRLSWTNPLDADFVGVRIRYRTDRFPSDINDGTLLGDISGGPGQEMSVMHTGLNNGVSYFYLAAAYDGSGNFQNTVFVFATPKAAAVVETGSDESASAGGCGMIRPDGGNRPGPGDSTAMLTLIGVTCLTFLKKVFKSIPLALSTKTRAIPF